MMRRARLLVAYDGSAYHGFAASPGVRTVMGDLVQALETITRTAVSPIGAGRTDAGVHGHGQVVSLDLPEDTDLGGLARRVTALAGPAIAVRAASWAPADFDARFSALWRHYRYQVLNTAVPDPFRAATAWHVPQRLDIDLMRLACDPIVGEHDFSSFCRRPKQAPGDPAVSLVRRVLAAEWSRPEPDEPDLLRFEIRATSFCHQMVRSIVGLIVDVGRGRRSAGEVAAVVRARDRAVAGTVAPPHGLCLWEVGYPPDDMP